MDGLWIETAWSGFLCGALYQWLRKPALNSSSVVVKVQVAVLQGAHARRHTGNAQSVEVVNVTDNVIIAWM